METATTNTYKKYCANVYIAQCTEQHEKGETVILTTRYDKKNEHEIHNFLGKTKEGLFMYSITRSDGFNVQERAKRKAEKLKGYSENASKRSTEAYESRATKHEREFMSLGEPIKVGHHSEGRHRRLYEKYDKKMRKSIEETEKAEQYQQRAQYWEAQADKINLSMPDSLSYYEFKLEEARRNHKELKDNPEKRSHSYSLTYAKKEVNNSKKNLDLAVKLWGSDEEISQINAEKEAEAKENFSKKKSVNDLINNLGGFFFFGSDKEAFLKKIKFIKDAGIIEEGEKVQHVKAGLYLPVKHINTFLDAI